jgi:hypothetical protein
VGTAAKRVIIAIKIPGTLTLIQISPVVMAVKNRLDTPFKLQNELTICPVP